MIKINANYWDQKIKGSRRRLVIRWEHNRDKNCNWLYLYLEGEEYAYRLRQFDGVKWEMDVKDGSGRDSSFLQYNEDFTAYELEESEADEVEKRFILINLK